MKITENRFSMALLGEPKHKGRHPEDSGIGAEKSSDGVSLSGRERLKELISEIANTQVDADEMIGEIAASMDGGNYLPSADNVADAILDDMSLLGEILQWNKTQDS